MASENSSDTVVLQKQPPLAFIRLGTSDEKIVTLTEARMNSLLQALDSVDRDPNIQGLIITGGAPGSFCAGADIRLIQAVTDSKEGERLAAMGQEVFNRLESLRIPTVAAISGACAGGGCELALACTYRVLANTPDTRIGLPEVKLGIIPGFGGTQRLPRVVGAPAALDIILKGKLVTAEQAEEIGLADCLVSVAQARSTDAALHSQLVDTASQVALGRKRVSRKKPSLRDRFLTSTSIGRNMMAKEVRARVMKESRGLYPALPRAIEAVMVGLSQGKSEGLKFEAKAIGELVVSSESKSLVHVFQLTEQSSKRWRTFAGHFDAARIGVVGAGTMGMGIATAIVLADLPVTLIDPFPQARDRAQKHIEKTVAKRKGEAAARNIGSRLEVGERVDQLRGCDLVIEAVIEDLELKKKVMQDIARVLSPRAIIASNTSSLPVSEFTKQLDQVGRTIGMHFFNPAEKMPLVEVVQTGLSDERTIAMTAGLATRLGKYPVVVHEVPGFLVNRVLSPYLLEAAFALFDGYSVEQIDRAAMDFGMPMGPLRLVDEIGLDVAAKVAQIIGGSYGDRMTGPNPSAKLAEMKRLGRKGGSGFYRYPQEPGAREVPMDDIRQILGINVPAKTDTKLLGERLILPMVNEAIRALDEGVAGQPGKDAAEQIDLGTVMGLGFAPFRGGVIQYAEQRGARSLKEQLEAFEKELGPRFRPAEGVVRRAASGESFYRS